MFWVLIIMVSIEGSPEMQYERPMKSREACFEAMANIGLEAEKIMGGRMGSFRARCERAT